MKRRRVEKEHVERAVRELQDRGLLGDTGPSADGRRSSGQWLAAIQEDAGLVRWYLEDSLRDGEDSVRFIAAALKEAQRLQSDVYRFAAEVHGLSRAEIEAARGVL